MSVADKPAREIHSLVETSEYAVYLTKVRDLTQKQGWAVSNPKTRAFLHRVNAWGFPKYPERTVILPAEADLITALDAFIQTNTLLFGENNLWLGTWKRPRTDEIYLDITTSCLQLADALEMTTRINAGSSRKIIAIHNAHLDKTVYL